MLLGCVGANHTSTKRTCPGLNSGAMGSQRDARLRAREGRPRALPGVGKTQSDPCNTPDGGLYFYSLNKLA